MWDEFIQLIKDLGSAFDNALFWVKELIDSIKDNTVTGDVWKTLASTFDSLKDSIKGAYDWVVSLVKKVGEFFSLGSSWPTFGGGLLDVVIGALTPGPGKAGGGIIPGGSGSPFPIVAHGGEAVIPERVVRGHRSLFEKLIDGDMSVLGRLADTSGIVTSDSLPMRQGGDNRTIVVQLVLDKKIIGQVSIEAVTGLIRNNAGIRKLTLGGSAV
jgi:hypothetical protein